VPDPKTHFKCACQNCGGHIEFPASGVGQTILCPHCGWQTALQATLGASGDDTGASPSNPQSRPRRKFFAVGLAVAVLAAAGGTGTWYFLTHRPAPPLSSEKTIPAQAARPAPATVVPAPPPDPWHGLKAGPVSLEKAESGGLVYAVGVLRNESDRQRFGIKVELNLLNAQGEKVGSASDQAGSILPGKEWKFKALVMERKSARAEVARVTEQE